MCFEVAKLGITVLWKNVSPYFALFHAGVLWNLLMAPGRVCIRVGLCLAVRINWRTFVGHKLVATVTFSSKHSLFNGFPLPGPKPHTGSHVTSTKGTVSECF